MDDRRIHELTEEVLSHLRPPSDQRVHLRGRTPAPSADLESRVSALEASVARLEGPASTAPSTTVVVAHAHAHPSLRVLNVPGGSDRCVLEPDKPCVQSQACRVLGH